MEQIFVGTFTYEDTYYYILRRFRSIEYGTYIFTIAIILVLFCPSLCKISLMEV